MTIGRMLGSTFAPTQKIRMMRERHDDAIRPPVTALVGFPLFLLFLQEIISGSRWFPAEILGCGR
jgi:hypothetical protein